MTVEEIEILVTAKVTDALKEISKLKPQIKQIMGQAQNEIEKLDFESIEKEASKASNSIKNAFDIDDASDIKIKINGKDIDEFEKDIKNVTNEANNAIESVISKTSSQDIHFIQYDPKEIENYIKAFNSSTKKELVDKMDFANKFTSKEKNIESKIDSPVSEPKNLNTWDKLKAKIEQVQPAIENAKLKMDAFFHNDSSGSGNAELDLTLLKISQIEEKLEKAKNGEIKLSFEDGLKAEVELDKLKQKEEELEKSQSGSGFFEWLKNGAKEAVSFIQSAFSKIKSVIGKKASSVGSGFKTGLKDVLKYAGALFSIRSIYSGLKSLASNWLSSSSAEAQQASANIDYMKNALSSGLAPVMQTLINLAYQFLKAIQSVVYAMTKVNIFANASASSMKKTSGSASQASKSLSSVHSEINNVSSNDSSGSSSASPSIDLSQVDNTPNSIIEAIENGDWGAVGSIIGTKLNEAMDMIPWQSIQAKAKTIGTNIALFLNGFIGTADWNQVGNTIAQGLNTAIYFAYGFLTTFNFEQFGSAISNTINGFLANTDWGTLAQTISAGIVGIFDTITGFIETFDWSNVWTAIVTFLGNIDWAGIVSSAVECLATAMASFLNLGMIIGNWIGEQIDKAKDFFTENIEKAGGDVGLGILNGILVALGNLGNWIRENVFQPFINKFKELFGIHSPSTVMIELGGYIMQGLLNGISALVSKIQEIWNNIKTKFKEGAQGAWNAVTGVFGKVKDWFQEKFSEAWTAVKNVFSKGGEVFSGIKEGIESTFKNIVNGLIDGINKVVSVPFNAINKVLEKIRDINILGVTPFKGLISTISIPQLPHLKTGNVAYEETFAVFGEYSNAKSNPEITTPQNVMAETFENVMSRHQGSNNQQHLSIYYMGKEIFDDTIDYINEKTRRTGKCVIKVT